MNLHYKKYTRVQNHILLIGFGSIGQGGVLPLIFRHLEVNSSQITILSKDGDKLGVAQEFGILVGVLCRKVRNFPAHPYNPLLV